MLLFIRSETSSNETRSPLSPADVKKLYEKGFTVFVQRSVTRVFSDAEFAKANAILTDEPWFKFKQKALIIGLKELQLEELNHLDNHSHVYFSHSYKNQAHATQLLTKFKISHSKLYDLEYFLNPDGSRYLAFGFYAGLVGAALGLRQAHNKRHGLQDISQLHPWPSINALFDYCKIEGLNEKIGIIGNGRCAKGVIYVLNNLNIQYEILTRNSSVDPKKYSLFFNCILLDKNNDSNWFPKTVEYTSPLTIVDISCDYNKVNNPISIYEEPTTWTTPVFNYNRHVSVIAIGNLPSLLPHDSSMEFSSLFTELLLNYGDIIWQANLNLFNKQIQLI